MIFKKQVHNNMSASQIHNKNQNAHLHHEIRDKWKITQDNLDEKTTICNSKDKCQNPS